MIEKTTGSIKVASDKTINPFMSLEEVKNMRIGESQAEIDMGNGWVWYDVKSVLTEGYNFNISFAFNNRKLYTLNLVFSSSIPTSNTGWESWSEKEELQNAITYNNWLNAEIGTERIFSWGEAWAGYDPKGGFSSIGVRYKN